MAKNVTIAGQRSAVIDWLLEEENPSVRYRTLTELLDRPADDPEAAAAKAEIPDSEPVRKIFRKMHPEGYWLQKKPSTGEMIGDGVEYGSYATTHFALAYLAELGLDRSHPEVAWAADRYLSLQQPDGDFWNHISCLNGYNLRNFLRLGYRDDPRFQRTLDLMLNTTRSDNGYLCDMHEGKYKTRAVKSCIRGSGKMLVAFAEMPETWDHPRVQGLVAYFLDREVLFKTSDPKALVDKNIIFTCFPFTWTITALELLYAFSTMGYGDDPRLARAWRVLEERQVDLGRYRLDYAPGQAILKPGPRGEANKWITFYALLSNKRRADPAG
jgi:hypothetical protein